MTNRPIALDARELPLGVSGDRTYLLCLLRELLRQAPERRFVLCYADGSATGLEPSDLAPNLETVFLPMRPGWLWTPVAWPRWLRRQHAAIAHAQHLIPPLSPCPTVLTIHDVSFLAHPEWFPAKQLRVMRRLIPLSAKAATVIVTGSGHAAGEIARYCRVRREKIRVIPYAAGEQYRPVDPATARSVADGYGLPERYLLAVGLLQPRKNLPRLLEAFRRIAPSQPGVMLAVAGRTGWAVEAIHQQVETLGLADRVKFLGAVPDEHLPALYSGAVALAYPSLYEGFGLPPLEAMQCGTPVVASNTSSIPEVVGEAGMLVDPTDVAALADGLERLLSDPAEAQRLATAGLARSAEFSWQACAKAHLALYDELVDCSGPASSTTCEACR